MTYKYSLIMLCAFGAFYNTFAIENAFDEGITEKIRMENEKTVKESKESLKNLTGALINPIKEKMFPTKAKDTTTTEFDKVCKLIDSLPTLHSVRDFVSLITKIEEHKPNLSASELENFYEKVHLIENKMDVVTKRNFFNAVLITAISNEMSNEMKDFVDQNEIKYFVNNYNDFVDYYNKKHAKEIAEGTVIKQEYADSSEILTLAQEILPLVQQENLINECKRRPFISRIAKLYAQHQFAMIAGGTALLTGICALVYKVYQKYYGQKNNPDQCKVKNISSMVVADKR
ncbi:hypothetical protein EKK58_10835 [Candidatus Dependentiae bacterium]|nr:MAG: hypothetical protein EKK58_10835 [Candidatus Dependentiae bacterium]